MDFLLDLSLQHFPHIVIVEGHRCADDDEEDAPHRPDVIHFRVVWISFQDLRSCIRRAATVCPGQHSATRSWISAIPCESEICDLDAIVFGQKQIFALHIAVNNVYWVAIWNSTADIAEEPFGVSILLRAVALYETQQIPIFCPVHEDENSCFEFEDGFDFNHRLVIKLPDDVQLSRHEFLDEIFRRFPFTDDFAGVTLFLTIRIGVFGKLNFGVRSFAEDPAEGVSLSPQIGFLASRPSISVILHIRAGVDHLCYQDL